MKTTQKIAIALVALPVEVSPWRLETKVLLYSKTVSMRFLIKTNPHFGLKASGVNPFFIF